MRQSSGAHRSQEIATQRGSIYAYSLVMGLLLLISAYWAWRGLVPGRMASVEDRLVLGAQVFAENCAVCHGPAGEGHAQVAAAPALDAREHAWHHPDGQLQQVIQEGGQVMPSFSERLTHEEIVAVIRYIQTWWDPGQLQSQQSLSAQFPLQE